MKQLIETLRRHEGVRQYVYKDHLGYETIGVGRCIREGVGMGLSDEEIDYLLLNDIKRCTEELNDRFPWFKDLNIVRQDAMVNLCFNLGISRLSKFKKSLAHMEASRFSEAADEFLDSRWSKQVGKRAIEVTDMIRTGEYQG